MSAACSWACACLGAYVHHAMQLCLDAMHVVTSEDTATTTAHAGARGTRIVSTIQHLSQPHPTPHHLTLPSSQGLSNLQEDAEPYVSSAASLALSSLRASASSPL